MILEGMIVISAVLLGRYLIPSKKARRLGEVSFQRLNGTYRDPALYEVTCKNPDEEDKYFKVRNIKEIPEPYRTMVVKGFTPRHTWMTNFLTEKDSKEED